MIAILRLAIAILGPLLLAAAAPPPAPVPQTALVPPPSGDPRTVTAAADPLIAWVEAPATPEPGAAIAAAAIRDPAARETLARADEAEGLHREARAAARPHIDLDLTSQHVVARGFSHDPGNLIERSRPAHRTDLSLSAEQPLWDFGATPARIAAARDRTLGERARAEAALSDAALAAARAWEDWRTGLAVQRIADAQARRTERILADTRTRIAAGASAQGEADRVEANLGTATAAAARARGQVEAARARFAAAFGQAPPADPPPARAPATALPDLAAALDAARTGPEARFAATGVEAAARDLAAVRADRLPRIAFGIDAAKYSAFDGVEDHDIRARLTLRHRLYGGGASGARADQAAARLAAAGFERDRIVQAGEVDAAAAWADARARTAEAAARRAAYLAQRRARDGYAEQFRVERGTLIELLRAEDDLFEAAITCVEAAAAAQTARWTLLARTGLLLAALGIEAP